MLLKIAKYYLQNKTEQQTVEALSQDFKGAEEFLSAKVYLKGITIDSATGIVTIPFMLDGDKQQTIKVGLYTKPRVSEEEASKWQQAGRYFYLIVDGWSASKDLKGSEAPATDPLIQKLIWDGKIAEIYLSRNNKRGEKNIQLKANRLEWISDYAAGITRPEIYRGHSIDINKIYTEEEQNTLIAWLEAHKVSGETIKIRVILGNEAIMWKEAAGNSNIAHAGIRDGVIYIGGILLKFLLKAENEEARAKILNDDEYRHLIGLDHGTDEEHKERLKLVDSIIEKSGFERYRKALEKNKVYDIKEEIEAKLNEPERLLEMMAVFNDIILGQPLSPVESSYPIKKAVALLDAEKQARFIDILTSETGKDYRKLIVVDDILLTMDESCILENWVRVHAPELEGRTVWQVSPEIWHEAGGLARVMQYHGVKIKKLLENSGTTFRQIEPHYQLRLDADGTKKKFDYDNPADITHPLKVLKTIDSFIVTVQGKEVPVEVSSGVNDLGIEVFLIRDRQSNGSSFYTSLIYNYRNENNPDSSLPEWEEFSVFYSKAAMEFIRRQEDRERTIKKREQQEWKAPLIHLNDSQTGLVAVYMKILLDKEIAKKEKDPNYTIDPFLENATVFFTTHTYWNRRSYGEGHHENAMKAMEIPEEYYELFKHLAGDKHDYDVTSAALRCAHGQSAVSEIQRNDIAQYDEWVNDASGNRLKRLFKKLKLYLVRVIAISNGDNREKSTECFRGILEKTCGDNINAEHITPKQILSAKTEAKKKLKIPGKKGVKIDPGKILVSYSGRLVDEKVGLERAFTANNIRRMVELGYTVVIYGNLQNKMKRSEELRDIYIKLEGEINKWLDGKEQEEGKKAGKYGEFIFVSRFTQKEQRDLMAATDIQVQDSHEMTEAAGFTEADIAACGGLACSPLWRKKGDGLQIKQGLPIDMAEFRRANFGKDELGKGNTFAPYVDLDWGGRTPEDYYKA
ncbi:MAG: glycogen/starch synthase, partial [Candidatus Omnitrophica bacterium]|nr:glycogen/starch synthase [Candidatus Omnitrophota bacterium]